MKRLPALLLCAVLASCAGSNERMTLPYPAFIPAEALFPTFLAALPGVSAVPYRIDERNGSYLVSFPEAWRGSSGGEPGKAVELYVLSGSMRLSDFELGPGGYAYLPPGGLGFRMYTDTGAEVLYFVDEPLSSAVIRAPIILDSGLVAWEPQSAGVSTRMLRDDPGSGERTWLQRVDAGAVLPWTVSKVTREGVLVSGQLRHSECQFGIAITGDYLPGSYFRRPPDTVHGGPLSVAAADSVWLLRERGASEARTVDACEAPAP